MNKDIEIRYTKSRSGQDTCFHLENDGLYFPPHDQFIDLMGDENKELADLIWYLCLFKKFGKLQTNCLFNGVGIWTSYYDFEIDGIPGILVYDDEYKMISNFSVVSGNVDDRKKLAESLRDLIVNEGRNISYNDWLEKNDKTEPENKEKTELKRIEKAEPEGKEKTELERIEKTEPEGKEKTELERIEKTKPERGKKRLKKICKKIMEFTNRHRT